MPTLADLIAQCPPDVRAHIERLETATDPAGLAVAFEAQRENAAALAARVVELEAELRGTRLQVESRDRTIREMLGALATAEDRAPGVTSR